MGWFTRVCVLAAAMNSASLAQLGSVPGQWTGTWKLDVKESTFGIVLVPGVPADFKILNQVLRIEQTPGGIRLAGDTTFSAGGESETERDDNTLRLDGTPTDLGPLSLSFRRIDNSTFEIISAANVPNSNVAEVSRYVFSPDGEKLVATKVQTERASVPPGTDKSKGAVIRTSKFILVYDKVPEPNSINAPKQQQVS
jgi:hypothetical protein